jgi:hypothetical protein
MTSTQSGETSGGSAQTRCSVCLRRRRDSDEWEQVGNEFICPACVELRDAANPPNVVVPDVDGRLRVVPKADL